MEQSCRMEMRRASGEDDGGDGGDHDGRRGGRRVETGPSRNTVRRAHAGSGSNDADRAPTDTRGASDSSSSSEELPLVEQESRDLRKVLLTALAALGVGAAVYAVDGPSLAAEYVTAYLVEQSLSVDNLFVFILLFGYFRVPRAYQEKVLGYGIAGAAAFRALFIFTGSALLERFHVVSLLFAGVLLFSSGKLLWSSARGHGDRHDDGGDGSGGGSKSRDDDVSDNAVVRLVSGLLPVSAAYDGDRFFTYERGSAADNDDRYDDDRHHNHNDEQQQQQLRRIATPLMLVLVCIELSDVVFALDSVPACLGISRHPFVVYASNLMAILGLRSWFFVIEDALRRFRFLEESLALILGFIGAKLSASFFGYSIDTMVSLSVVVGILAGGYALSVVVPPTSSSSSSSSKSTAAQNDDGEW